MLSQFLDKYQNELVVGVSIFALLFIIIGHIYRDQIQAKFKKPLATVPAFDIDYWSVTHFMLFAFFGFVFPNHAFTFACFGAMFELFEDGVSSDDKTQLIDCKNKDTKSSFIGNIYCNGDPNSYWYAKLDDIAINVFGYITGQGIRNTFVL